MRGAGAVAEGTAWLPGAAARHACGPCGGGFAGRFGLSTPKPKQPSCRQCHLLIIEPTPRARKWATATANTPICSFFNGHKIAWHAACCALSSTVPATSPQKQCSGPAWRHDSAAWKAHWATGSRPPHLAASWRTVLPVAPERSSCRAGRPAGDGRQRSAWQSDAGVIWEDEWVNRQCRRQLRGTSAGSLQAGSMSPQPALTDHATHATAGLILRPRQRLPALCCSNSHPRTPARQTPTHQPRLAACVRPAARCGGRDGCSGAGAPAGAPAGPATCPRLQESAARGYHRFDPGAVLAWPGKGG